MPVIDNSKRIAAEEVAAAVLEWDYETASDSDLYEALEVLGFEWDGQGWNIPGYTAADDAGSLWGPEEEPDYSRPYPQITSLVESGEPADIDEGDPAEFTGEGWLADSYMGQFDDDPSPYAGDYSED